MRHFDRGQVDIGQHLVGDQRAARASGHRDGELRRQEPPERPEGRSRSFEFQLREDLCVESMFRVDPHLQRAPSGFEFVEFHVVLVILPPVQAHCAVVA